ncbi:MAG: galactose oxidase-like domain-containing protein, partial [Gammaproteobacteria bacterium]
MKAHPLSPYQIPIFALLAGVSIFSGLTPSAMAQMVGFPDPAAVHAQEDLANRTMGDFEANADPQAGLNPEFSASVAAALDPGTVGKWSGIIGGLPVVPIFVALLPDGRALMWDSVGDNPAESYTNHTFTRAAVWDPGTSTFTNVNLSGHNLFCAGFAHLTDGSLFVAGGNKDKQLNGIKQTHIFDYNNDTWYAGPNMASERWYPSVATLADGEHVVMGGGPSIPEVTQGDHTSFRKLTKAGWGSHAREYPFVQLAPNGKVLYAGPNNKMKFLGTQGTGTWQILGARDTRYRYYGSYAIFNANAAKWLVAGGGPSGAAPTNTAVVIDVSASGAPPVASSTGNMNYKRRQHNLTVLPDGTVLATGGLNSTAGLVDLNAAVYHAELWTPPPTGTWKILAPQAVARQYHSVALLLPDGRVMSGGGGVCGKCQQKGYLRKDIEIFSPPYLFKKDGTGLPADRPQIFSAPSDVHYGVPFTINVTQGINKIALTKLA